MNEQTMKVLIVDDEESSRAAIRSFLQMHADDVSVVAEADSVVSGIGQIIMHKPDLVFLDVRMQDGTGFDLLERLPERNFQVVFVTSFDQYAIQAFRFSAIDYILKPVDPDQLNEAVNKARQAMNQNDISSKLEVLVSNISKLEKLALPSMDGIRFVRIDDVVRCESDDNYTNVYLRSGDKIVVSKTLKEYERLLEPMQFFRVHKQHLVNLRFVEKYIPGDGGYLILEDGSHVDVSRRKKDQLMELLMK